MKKILLTGVTGQVGQELQKTLVPLGEIVSVTRQDLDLTEPEQIRRAIAELKPDLLVNAAAYTAVDKAENESKLATSINGVAPTIMAESAQKLGATLVHISTDYVFNGQNYTPYTEEDPPAPLGVYGKSKLMGEEGVRNNCDHHIILRTAWVYGSRGHGNFVKTMLRLGAEREQLRVVSDQIGSPTWSYDIATAITRLVSQSVTGTYNFSSSGVASWYDFAVAIFSEAERLGFPLKIKEIVPITTAEYPTPTQRPAYSVLSKVKITQTLGNYPAHWQESLQQMLSEWQAIVSH